MLEKKLSILFKEARKSQKLSLEDVALRARVQKSNVSRFENNIHSPSLKTIEKYAHAIGFSVTISLAKNQSDTEERNDSVVS